MMYITLSVQANAKYSHRDGFTLVELLAAVGIVAVLIGMLIPVLSAARRSARNVACLSNLRQWSQAALMYANTNGGFLPRRGQGQQPTHVIDRPSDWFNALPPLMGMKGYNDLAGAGEIPAIGDSSTWICPEAVETTHTYLFTYGMNMRLSTWNATDPDRITAVGDAGTLVFMADGPGEFCAVLPFASAFSPVARHGGRVNLVFLDGHATSFPGSEIGCGVGDPLRQDVRWAVPNSPWKGP